MPKVSYDINKKQRTFFIVINKKVWEVSNPAVSPLPDLNNLKDYIVKHLKPDYFALSFEDGSKFSGDHDTDLHLHLYLEFSSPRYPTAISKHFPGCHFELINDPDFPDIGGNPCEMRDYVFKLGKHTPKAVTQICPPVEFGNWDVYKDKVYRKNPKTTPSSKTKQTSAVIKDLFNSCSTAEEFLLADPALYQRNRYVVDKLYSMKKEQEFLLKSQEIQANDGSSFFQKNLKVVYIWGGTGTGKTYGVQLTHGMGNVSILTSYPSGDYNQMIYDDYNSTSVMVLDEFRSSIKISEMLTLLDRSITDLRCRFQNKKNVADIIYILSNIPFSSQYKKLQEDKEGKLTFEAFERRFSGGIWMMYYSKYLKRRYLLNECSYLPNKYPQIPYDFSCPLATCEVIDYDQYSMLTWLDENYQALDDYTFRELSPELDILKLGNWEYVDVYSDESGLQPTSVRPAYLVPSFYEERICELNSPPHTEEPYGIMPF